MDAAASWLLPSNAASRMDLYTDGQHNAGVGAAYTAGRAQPRLSRGTHERSTSKGAAHTPTSTPHDGKMSSRVVECGLLGMQTERRRAHTTQGWTQIYARCTRHDPLSSPGARNHNMQEHLIAYLDHGLMGLRGERGTPI